MSYMTKGCFKIDNNRFSRGVELLLVPLSRPSSLCRWFSQQMIEVIALTMLGLELKSSTNSSPWILGNSSLSIL